jgi:hypothetical protein
MRNHPKLQRHKPSNRGKVVLNGHYFYCGKWGPDPAKPLPECQAEYDRLIALWLANGRRLPGREADDLTVDEIIARFREWVEEYYRHPDGRPTSEQSEFRQSLKPLRQLFADKVARLFGPQDLKAVRNLMIESGLARSVINKRIVRIIKLFKWSASEELIPGQVAVNLRTVDPLQPGRSKAKETKPVEAVAPAVVAATLPLLLPMLADMVALPGDYGPIQLRRAIRAGLQQGHRPISDVGTNTWIVGRLARGHGESSRG